MLLNSSMIQKNAISENENIDRNKELQHPKIRALLYLLSNPDSKITACGIFSLYFSLLKKARNFFDWYGVKSIAKALLLLPFDLV
jgi:hypothetical protein